MATSDTEDSNLLRSEDKEKSNNKRRKKLLIILGFTTAIIFIALVILTVTINGEDTALLPTGFQVDSTFHAYSMAAVATDSPVCSKVGSDILKRGGSAVDASIASTLCAGLINSHNTGIGGGSVMLIYDVPRKGTEKEMVVIDSRERAPLAASPAMFSNEVSSSRGGKAIAVPGEIAGYFAAWEKFGRLPWKDLFMPTITMAREGFIVSPILAEHIEEEMKNWNEFSNIKNVFLKEDGSPYLTGETIKFPKLADTLEVISDEGLRAFYNGSLTEDIIADIQEAGGIITVEDLQQFKITVSEAVKMPLKHAKLTVYGAPPPSSGSVLNFMLALLDGHLDAREEEVLSEQKIIEAMKFGMAQRSYLSDPDFVNVTEVMHEMTSAAYIDEIRRRIDTKHTHDIPYYDANYIPQDGGTSHLSVLSDTGGAVAITSTINLYFGSYVVGTRTGILFNDEMDDFSQLNGLEDGWGSAPSTVNIIEPGKRPMSSMSPTIILDDNEFPVFIIGASGGMRIFPAIFYVLTHSIYLDSAINEAVDLSRLYHLLNPNILEYESDYKRDVLEELKKKGHKEKLNTENAVVQVIQNTCSTCADDACLSSCIIAVSDGRKGGIPDGY